MLVTFKLSLKDIYKNAFIFATVKFFKNAGILLLCVVLSAIPFLVFPVIASKVYYSLMILSLIFKNFLIRKGNDGNDSM